MALFYTTAAIFLQNKRYHMDEKARTKLHRLLAQVEASIRESVAEAITKDQDEELARAFLDLYEGAKELRSQYEGMVDLRSTEKVNDVVVADDSLPKSQESDRAEKVEEDENAHPAQPDVITETFHEEDFPIFGLNPQNRKEILKVGHGKGGFYSHRASLKDLRTLLEALRIIRNEQNEFTADDILAQVGDRLSRYQLYVVLGLLREVGLVDRPKRGTYCVRPHMELAEKKVFERARYIPPEYIT